MKLRDRVLEAVAADESHGVKRPSIVEVAQRVDWHNPRMLKPAGNFRLEQEPSAGGGMVGMVGLELLERHLAVELGVARDKDFSLSASGVRPQDAEPA